MGRKSDERAGMGAITTAILAVAGMLLGWAAIEIACRPCLRSGRSALERSLNPDYDPDDEFENGAQTSQSGRPDEEEEEAEEDVDVNAKKPVVKPQ